MHAHKCNYTVTWRKRDSQDDVMMCAAVDAQCLGSWKDGQTTHYALRDGVTPYVSITNSCQMLTRVFSLYTTNTIVHYSKRV